MEFWVGLKLALSLIVAIGAQNAFVLRQGILREHVLPVVAFCALSDAVLIGIGVVGAGAFAAHPVIQSALRWGGVGFLLWYGARSARAAWRGGATLELGATTRKPLGAILGSLAALTLLNPHVWLDTVVLIGAVSAQYAQPLMFGLGAACGSVLFFTALGYGARYLAPVFARPDAWRGLDGGIAILMWSIAWSLATGA
ncbi:LysE/ArgO family amino acid transporter [Albirhodobacter sp. R86504]|uniref:LysE/ArgO family amino acid transporter n=1 Tax=Albirhodobacter sp. R86504 TaxID=3093848 RepID=UPI0036729CBF